MSVTAISVSMLTRRFTKQSARRPTLIFPNSSRIDDGKYPARDQPDAEPVFDQNADSIGIGAIRALRNFNAIVSMDPDGARTAMRDHINSARKRVFDG